MTESTFGTKLFIDSFNVTVKLGFIILDINFVILHFNVIICMFVCEWLFLIFYVFGVISFQRLYFPYLPINT